MPLFLDLSFDIQTTVADAMKVASGMRPFMLNVPSGGPRMRAAARAARLTAESGGFQPLVVGVTVLTSLGEDDLSTSGSTGRLSIRR